MAVLSQRSERSENDREQTFEAVLDATVGLLATGAAFADLTIGDISTAAGVSRPTFYAYFRDKRALVLALGHRFEANARAASADWMSMRVDDVRGTLEAVFAAFAANRHALRAVSEAAGYDDEVAGFWRAFHERYMDQVARRIVGTDPDRSDEEAEAAAFTLVWMTERSFSEQLQAPRVREVAMLDAVEHLWNCALPGLSPNR